MADGAAPHAVLTGRHALFIGDVGRPDLLASVGVTLGGARRDAPRLAARASSWRCRTRCSCTPAHGAGSLCGKNLSTDTVSTIGAQRQRETRRCRRPIVDARSWRMVTAARSRRRRRTSSTTRCSNKRERPLLEDNARARSDGAAGQRLRSSERMAAPGPGSSWTCATRTRFQAGFMAGGGERRAARPVRALGGERAGARVRRARRRSGAAEQLEEAVDPARADRVRHGRAGSLDWADAGRRARAARAGEPDPAA